MEINLVVLNVGNSRLAIGTFVAGELSDVIRLSHSEREKWDEPIASAWATIKSRENAAIVAAGVNPPMERALDEAVLAATDRLVVWVGDDLELPIKVRTEAPDLTGVDRVLNVAVAFEQLGRACVVVDAGSAVTVDCCDDDGALVGGAIAPGVAMQLDALHEKTAGLPELSYKDLSAPTLPYGRNTRDAIVQGVYHGIRGLVKEVVENYATALGRWPEVIATGGDAKALFEGWELIHAVSPDLTLHGIALAYAEHHIKLDSKE